LPFDEIFILLIIHERFAALNLNHHHQHDSRIFEGMNDDDDDDKGNLKVLIIERINQSKNSLFSIAEAFDSFQF
jgi:hypothetical protein